MAIRLTKHQTDSKKRLNKLCDYYGFEPLRGLLRLSGSSLGQYLAHDTHATISDTKLRLAEVEYKLSCAR